MDLVARVERAPAPGENVFGRDFQTIPGGKGANQAVGVARLGAEAVFVGRVGADGFGDALRANLRNEGVDIMHLLADADAPSGTALIIVNGEGDNFIVICPGANGRVMPEDIDNAADTLAACDAIVMQLEIPIDTVAHAICRAKEWGVPTVLDAGPPCPDPPDVFFGVDILTPNLAEAAALLGRESADPEAAASELLGRGARVVVLKLGARGAFIATADERQHLPTQKITPIDTTAAGDAFTAALAVFHAEGLPLAEAVALANRAGALACLTHGAQPSMPTRESLRSGNQPLP